MGTVQTNQRVLFTNIRKEEDPSHGPNQGTYKIDLGQRDGDLMEDLDHR